MPLLPDQIDDFVTNTQAKVNRKTWVDLSLDKQKYWFAWLLQQKAKKNKPVDHGSYRKEFTVQTTNTGSFQDSEMFASVQTTVKDLNTTGYVLWAKQLCSYMYDIDEDLFQGSPEMIIRTLEVRIHSMFNDFFEGMEERMWTSPTSSTQNPRRPSGIPFWIQKSATAAFGFNGGDPANFSAGAGNIAVADVPNWNNGTFTYQTLSDDDGIDKWVEAIDKCHFMAPHDFSELAGGKPDYSFFTTYPVLQVLRKYLRNQNDDLGGDVAAFRGNVLLRGTPVFWVPALTNTDSAAYDVSNPIYGINWNTFDWFFQKGRNRHMTKPMTPSNQPTVRKVYLINWGNFECVDRRSNFVAVDSDLVV